MLPLRLRLDVDRDLAELNAPPLVLLHKVHPTESHYQPLAASWNADALNKLPYANDIMTPQLKRDSERFVGACCSAPSTSAVDDD